VRTSGNVLWSTILNLNFAVTLATGKTREQHVGGGHKGEGSGRGGGASKRDREQEEEEEEEECDNFAPMIARLPPNPQEKKGKISLVVKPKCRSTLHVGLVYRSHYNWKLLVP